MHRVLLSFLFLLTHLSAAQTITGVVTERGSKLPLPFANIFISNSTLGAATDADGKFVIQGKIPEEFELVASFVGYRTVIKTIRRKGSNVMIQDFELELLADHLSEVQLKSKRDKAWERNLKQFKTVFLAVMDDPYGREIEILNPWVVDFENVKSRGANYIKASSQLPLKIVNKALGYEIDYHLQFFRMNRGGSSYYGPAFFKAIDPVDSLEKSKWAMARELNYENSIRHLAVSLLVRNSSWQGFDVYRIIPDAALRLRTNVLYEEMGITVVPFSIFSLYSKPLGNGIYRIFLPGKMEIHHNKRPWPNDYYSDFFYAISWMEALDGYFDVDRNGTLVDPTQLVLSGYMGRQRMARSLPLDYLPTGGFNGLVEQIKEFQARHVRLNTLREKAWLTSNKPYFHAGETMWLGGKMLYQNPSNADSLSKVLYVDLIDSQSNKVREEIFRIDQGRISGGILLDKNLPPGDYLVRAYTHWSMNFPTADIFELPIPILAEGIYPQAKNQVQETLYGDIGIQTHSDLSDSTNYRVLEVELRFLDEFENPVDTEFILSAMHESVAVELSEEKRLEKELHWMDLGLPELFDSDLPYQIEYGISVAGEYVPTKKTSPAVTTITLVRDDLADYGTVSTDTSARFWATGLYFQDTAQLAIAALDAKQRSTGSVRLIQFERPAFSGTVPKVDYLVKTSLNKNDLNLDLSGNFIQLEEFVIEKQTKLESFSDLNYGYGKPNQEVGLNELETMTMDAIMGKLRFVNGRFGNYTFGEKTGPPLLIVDGQSMPFLNRESFGEIIGSYEPAMLKSIKVYYGNVNNAVFGMAGYSGVFMIETKNGTRSGPDSEQKFNSKEFQIFPIRGFTSFPEFPKDPPSDQYLTSKPTVYWDPLAESEAGIFKVRMKVPNGLSQLQLRVEGQTSDGDAFYRVIPLELK